MIIARSISPSWRSAPDTLVSLHLIRQSAYSRNPHFLEEVTLICFLLRNSIISLRSYAIVRTYLLANIDILLPRLSTKVVGEEKIFANKEVLTNPSSPSQFDRLSRQSLDFALTCILRYLLWDNPFGDQIVLIWRSWFCQSCSALSLLKEILVILLEQGISS